MSSRRKLERSPSYSLYFSISSFFFLRLPLFSRSTCFYPPPSLLSHYPTHLFLFLSLPLSVKTSSDCTDVVSILYAMRINKYSCGRVTVMQTVCDTSFSRPEIHDFSWHIIKDTQLHFGTHILLSRSSLFYSMRDAKEK